MSKTPKFYFFDVGMALGLQKQSVKESKGEVFGRAFEHLVVNQVLAYKSYREKVEEVTFWRTKGGVEVDVVLGEADVAIEVKAGSYLRSRDVRGLEAFGEDYAGARRIAVCMEPVKRLMDGVEVYPWQQFLDELWGGEIW